MSSANKFKHFEKEPNEWYLAIALVVILGIALFMKYF